MRVVRRRLDVFAPERLPHSSHAGTTLTQRQQLRPLDLSLACQSSDLNGDLNGTFPDRRGSRIDGALFPQEPSGIHAPTTDSC